MPISPVRCHVFGSDVVRVTDLEGAVTRVICPQLESASGLCRIRRDALSGGPLSQMIERVAEDTLDVRATRCDLL
jgi:hypothetical protein